ncbi:vomeronasal type-2 receptor 26-like [Ahaetulla prasina]|uniref:vomeronasal type-2 receptor 26-like n=1 Tax=Ahaetulla prasina TaxID=499056 RepID=UPI0026471CEB|nr:vomeronasal type-2 receptor 26-like [Ahaetulla prasina]
MVNMKALTEDWKILSFLFAIQAINKNPNILFNVTLGYNIYDNYFTAQMTSEALLDLLSEGEANVPNYSCGRQRNTMAVLEGADTDISFQILTMLGTYKIPQINHGFDSQVLSDENPFFYPMLPAEGSQYPGMVKLVLHFRWTLVGLLAPDNENGQSFMRTMTSLLVRNGICPVLSQTFSPASWNANIDSDLYFSWRKVKVFIYGADLTSFHAGISVLFQIFEMITEPPKGKVLIFTIRWDFTIYLSNKPFHIQYIHSIFSFPMKKNQISKYGWFLKFYSLMRHFEETSFLCSYTNNTLSVKVWRRCRQREDLEALKEEEMDPILTGDNYFIYNTIWAVARALNAAYISRSRRTFKDGKNLKTPMLKAWQLQPFLRSSQFYNNSIHGVYLDETGELVADLDIVNTVLSHNMSVSQVTVGSLERVGSSHFKFMMNQNAIANMEMLNKPLPPSRCVESCPPGFMKVAQEGKPICCYNCRPCPEGSTSTKEGFGLGIFIKFMEKPIVKANNRDLSYILLVSLLLSILTSFLFIGRPRKMTCLLRQTAFSIIFSIAISSILAKTITVVLAFLATKPGNKVQRWLGKSLANSIVLSCSGLQAVIYADKCTKCPDDQHPNINRVHCISKIKSYLSYKENLGIILTSIALFLSLTTGFGLGIFIKFMEKPIVKANNRDLSYILLLSLLLSILTSFLFIGRPRKMTCLLRQTAFSIIFSIAISSILAKTITVVLAFLATKPGNKVQRWLGKSLANSIVLSCSGLQAVICSIWLGTFPPFPDSDMHSQPREIILQCNEGSIIMFYVALGYMGFLSAVCFTVAFLARNLPGAFNEAKLISFSMLVFCSVWMSFVPAYLSTKGKYTVAVQIFSSLASSAGLLGCIFFPKCYIIIFRPDLNTKEHLMSK